MFKYHKHITNYTTGHNRVVRTGKQRGLLWRVVARGLLCDDERSHQQPNMHVNDRQKGGKEGGDHTPAAGNMAHDCQRGVGGRLLRRKNEPIRQGQDGHCRLLLL